jgi:hypothetical protein
MKPYFFATQHFPDLNHSGPDDTVLFIANHILAKIEQEKSLGGIGICGEILDLNWGKVTPHFHDYYSFQTIGTTDLGYVAKIMDLVIEAIEESAEGPPASKYFTILEV